MHLPNVRRFEQAMQSENDVETKYGYGKQKL
jgi:hypothetical protein